jgi:hypothetical protein
MLETICNSITHMYVWAFMAADTTFQSSDNISELKFLEQYSVFRDM